jgi:hypothetical protein
MIRKKPARGLDPGVGTGFPKSMPSGFDPMGAKRLPKKVTHKTKNLRRDRIPLNRV